MIRKTKNRISLLSDYLCKRIKVFLLCIMMSSILYPSLFAQNTQPVVNFEVKQASFAQIVEILRTQTNYEFIFNSDDVKDLINLTFQFKNKGLYDVLNVILETSKANIKYVLEGKTIIFKKSESDTISQQKTVSGTIFDQDKAPMFGVTIHVKDTKIGVYSDNDGKYSLPTTNIQPNSIIVFSFIGYETFEIPFSQLKSEVILSQTITSIDNAVVTAYFERDKSTFTGSAKTISGDQLRSISTTNIFNSLSILEPSISITQNNEQGSNPNAIPEIILRGTTSLNTSSELGVNSPLIVIDGVESSVRALYDINVFDIESVTVLKDASATALYGEQAANGVILVTRKRSSQKQVRVSYNLTGKFEFADLSGYDLMNASEKLEFERLSGLYDDKTGALYLEYVKKLAKVNSGINTDWISKPLRNSFSNQHSVNLSGEGSGLSYQVMMRYSSNNGVMQDDNRQNLGIGYYLSYNYKSKFIATLRTDYSQNQATESRFGKFVDYVNANPYDAPYDVNGELSKNLSYNLLNPLYESTLSSFSKSKDKEVIASLNLRLNILSDLYLVGFGSITNTENTQDQYTSPLSNLYSTQTDATLRGRYTISSAQSNKYLLRGTANYNRNLDDKGSMLSANIGGEIRRDNNIPYSFSAVGFFNDKLTDPTFASSYPIGERPSGVSSESATAAFTSSANLVYRYRYFVDGSYRLSGSSKFGTQNRFAPFWSVGAGWNLHREEWIKKLDLFNVLRLRFSYGHTGSINFASYQAITTYRYASNLVNKYGLGASPITMGNSNLKWQTTKSTNIGLTSSFLKERFDVNFDWYNYRTVDMIVPISMPPSSGVSLVNNNIGEQTNKGFELTLSGVVIKNKDLFWRVNATAAHNVNRLIKIGNTLKIQNDNNAAVSGGSPLDLFIEGQSTSMIYTVRSAGIDPASGREIYITKDGTYTYAYNPADKVAIGDRTPTLRGALSSFLTYKGFSFNISALYSNGGYIYNTTRAQRIEQINPMYNSDLRAYTDRWKKPGDVVNYLTIIPNANGTINNYHTSRFVEKENYISISFISIGYEFESKILNKIKCKRLNLGISINDIVRFSTIKQERGINYPFARGFSFTISPTF